MTIDSLDRRHDAPANVPVEVVAGSGGGVPAVKSSAALYAVAVLFFANLVGYLDRSILILLVQPVKQALRLSDGEIGLMQGAAFVLTFSFAGLFIGRLIDRINRRNLLFCCVLVWSLSSAACGFAQNGFELFVARMGVGVGEAALIPSAVSLIADYFSPARRGKPYGFFTMGVYAGSGLSLVLVGSVLARVTAFSHGLAARGVMVEPWRLVMFAMIVPGAVCCVLLATLREPARRTSGDVEVSLHRSGLQDWFARIGLFLPHHLFMALVTLSMYAMNAWMPTVLIREYALPTRTVGLLYGGVIAVTGVVSAYVGGILSDQANRRSGATGALAFTLGCVVVGFVGFALLLLARSPLVLMIGSIIVFSPLSMSLVTGITAMSDLSPTRSRGQISAIYFLFVGIIGTAGGPALVGYANDLLGGAGWRLSTILSLTGLGATLVAIPIAWLTLTRVTANAHGANR